MHHLINAGTNSFPIRRAFEIDLLDLASREPIGSAYKLLPSHQT